jgi:predicted O-methyltransferase YrrM
VTKSKVISENQKVYQDIASLVTKKSVVILDGITPRIKFKNPQGKMQKKIQIYSLSNVMLWDKRANV